MSRTRDPNAPLSPRIRYNLTRMGVGYVRLTAPKTTQAALRRYYGAIEKLIADSQVEALVAVASKRITLDQLVDLDRQDRLRGPEIVAAVSLDRPLFETWDDVLRDRTSPAWKRYAVARLSFERKCSRWVHARPPLRVRDLTNVDRLPWDVIAASWPGTPADWNHVRRALSRFLTILLRNKWHPFRQEFVSLMPSKPEPKHVPDLSPESFWRIVSHARQDVQASYVTLVVTGMRCITEYLACRPEHLMRDTKALRVPGTKTEGSANVIGIDPRVWPWIVAGIPSRVQYKRLRELWIQACDKAGHPRITLHTLRHVCAQWASDEGQSDGAIASVLRHASVATTRRYSRTTASREVSGSVADRLLTVDNANLVTLSDA